MRIVSLEAAEHARTDGASRGHCVHNGGVRSTKAISQNEYPSCSPSPLGGESGGRLGGGKGEAIYAAPYAAIAPPPSPPPVRGEGIEQEKSFPEIA